MGATEVDIKDGDSYTITKAITLKNGNVKGGTFIVERSGVKLENINNIEAVTVDEKVGSGDFSIKGCHEVSNLWVNGGGSKSVHIANSAIERLVVNKPLVRIALDADDAGKVSITHAIISQECKIESESGNTLTNVIVAKAEAKVTLAGAMSITNLVSEKSESVTKEGNTITITKENANFSDAGIEQTEIEEVISKAEQRLSPATSLILQEKPDAPQNLKLSSKSCNDGILIEIENPPAATEAPADYFMYVFIDGIGNVCQQWYNSESKNPPNKFFFPYVQAGKEYKTRIRFSCELKDENGNNIPDSAKDISWNEISVKANGGKGGDLMLLSTQEITSVNSNGDFKLKAPEFAQEPSGFDYEICIEPYTGKSWNVENNTEGWKYLGAMYVPKSEINTTHNIYEYLKDEWATPSQIDFINTFVRKIEKYDDGTVFEYRWLAKPKEHSDMQPLPQITWEQYSKLDNTPLTVTDIEERYPIIDDENAIKDQVYMFTYPITAESNKRNMRKGDNYTIEFSAKTDIDLEGLWVGIIYTKEEIDENGNTVYTWWRYPAEDYWEVLENKIETNSSFTQKVTVSISKFNAMAEEKPCLLVYIKPTEYKTDLTETPLKNVSATITSSNVTIKKE